MYKILLLFIFFTSISYSQNVGISTNTSFTPLQQLHVDGIAIFNGNVGIGLSNPSFSLHVNGRVKSDGISETSDMRLKKNIMNINNSISVLKKINGVKYNFISDTSSNKLEYGVLAQEVESVIPQIVITDNDGYKSVEYTKLIPFLIEAIKDQQKQIDSLFVKLNKIK